MRGTTRFAGILLASLATAAVFTTSMSSHAQGVPVEQATEEQKTAARENFTKGKEAFDAKKYEEALTALRASYDVVASPNSRILIAQCLEALGKPVEAFAEAEAVATQAQAAAAADPKYEETAKAAGALRDALRNKVGLVTVRVTGTPAAGAALSVEGRDIPRDQWEKPIAVTPGTVTVTLTGAPSQQVAVAAGAEASVELGAAPPPPPPPPPDEVEVSSSDNWFMQNRLPIGIAAGGVGVAGMLLFGIFGGMASSTYSDLEDQCPGGVCSPDLESDADSGRTYQTVANVSLVIGIVGVAAGAGLIVWDLVDPATTGDEGGEADGSTEQATAIVRPQLVVGPGAIGLRGSF
jgi:hypothetical protein